jgi:hypothetical protein
MKPFIKKKLSTGQRYFSIDNYSVPMSNSIKCVTYETTLRQDAEIFLKTLRELQQPVIIIIKMYE